jgi:hypothetical protein
MKKFLNFVIGAAFIFFVASPVMAATTPVVETAGASCDSSLLGIPPWYRGLTTGSDCAIVSPNSVGGIENFIWRVVLNVVNMGLVIVAYIAVFFIIYGGFLFITGGSNPAQVEKGKKSVLNAVVGLIIAMGSIAVTNFIFGIVAGAPTDANGIPTLTGEQILQNILNIAYFVAGAAAVVVIVISGLMYIASGGNAGTITKAKGMLTYSIAGLVVVLVAFAITNFVIGRFS